METGRIEAFSDGVISGGVLWANLHLLFWLSLTPFTTAWAGENHFTTGPIALYGVVLLMCGVAVMWFIPDRRIEDTLNSRDIGERKPNNSDPPRVGLYPQVNRAFDAFTAGKAFSESDVVGFKTVVPV